MGLSGRFGARPCIDLATQRSVEMWLNNELATSNTFHFATQLRMTVAQSTACSARELADSENAIMALDQSEERSLNSEKGAPTWPAEPALSTHPTGVISCRDSSKQKCLHHFFPSLRRASEGISNKDAAFT